MKVSAIFNEAFNTFKVVETLPSEIYGLRVKNHSKTIWQILNHLVIWQQYSIKKIIEGEDQLFDESESWIDNLRPGSKQELEAKQSEFKEQINFIHSRILTLSWTK